MSSADIEESVVLADELDRDRNRLPGWIWITSLGFSIALWIGLWLGLDNLLTLVSAH